MVIQWRKMILPPDWCFYGIYLIWLPVIDLLESVRGFKRLKSKVNIK